MNILVISDTHLYADFEEKKFNLLKHIISQADQVIINGDLWEGFLVDFNQFIQSPWNQLFPSLKTKHTVYLYGNHDRKEYMDQNMTLFSAQQTYRYELPLGEKTFIFEHGNRLFPFPDDQFHFKPARWYTHIHDITEHIMIRNARFMINAVRQRFNDTIKMKLRKELKPNEIYVCGHTHKAEVDLENQFINLGVIRHGLAQYMWIKNGEIQTQEEWYDR